MRHDQPALGNRLARQVAVICFVDDQVRPARNALRSHGATHLDQAIDARDRTVGRRVRAKNFQGNTDQVQSASRQYEVRQWRQLAIELRQVAHERRWPDHAAACRSDKGNELAFENSRGVGALSLGLRYAIVLRCMQEALFVRSKAIGTRKEYTDPAYQVDAVGCAIDVGRFVQRNSTGQSGDATRPTIEVLARHKSIRLGPCIEELFGTEGHEIIIDVEAIDQHQVVRRSVGAVVTAGQQLAITTLMFDRKQVHLRSEGYFRRKVPTDAYRSHKAWSAILRVGMAGRRFDFALRHGGLTDVANRAAGQWGCVAAEERRRPRLGDCTVDGEGQRLFIHRRYTALLANSQDATRSIDHGDDRVVGATGLRSPLHQRAHFGTCQQVRRTSVFCAQRRWELSFVAQHLSLGICLVGNVDRVDNRQGIDGREPSIVIDVHQERIFTASIGRTKISFALHVQQVDQNERVDWSHNPIGVHVGGQGDIVPSARGHQLPLFEFFESQGASAAGGRSGEFAQHEYFTILGDSFKIMLEPLTLFNR